MYNQTKDLAYLSNAYKLYPSIILHFGTEYSKNLESYISREYLEKGIKDIENEIESAKAEVERADEKLSSYKGNNKSTAKTILEEKSNKAELEYNNLKEKKEEFEKTANLMLPPSSDFLCEIMDNYLETAETLGKNQTASHQDICTAFVNFISPSNPTILKYKSINFKNVETTESWSTVIYKAYGGFMWMGMTKEITIEASLDSMQVSLTGSEQIIDKNDINVSLLVDNDAFSCNVKDLKINFADDLNTSSIYITISCDNSYERNMVKPDPKGDYKPSFSFCIESKDDFFKPLIITIQEEDNVFKELSNRLRYTGKEA